MRHARLQVAVDVDGLHLREPCPESIAQRPNTLVFRGHLGLGDSKRLAHANDLMRGQGARPHAALVTPTMDLRLDTDAGFATNKQCADALGPIGLMGRKRHQVHLEQLQIDGHFARGLGAVHMNDDALGTTELRNAGDVLDHANLVIDKHHRH